MLHDYPPFPAQPQQQTPVFTVTVPGPERHDGEAGYTYVVHADDECTARTLVLEYHAASHDLRAAHVCIETDRGPVWRSACDPAIRPDLAYVPAQSFPGPPGWPDDTPGRAWHDMRPMSEQALMLTALASEWQRQQVAQDFGLSVAAIDTGQCETPAVPAGDAVGHVMQLRARRAFSPGRPLSEGADTIAFILGSAHIRALTTAICDRDLANGVEPDEVGQVLVDANYHAYNLGAGTDEESPAYFHRRLDVDEWALLKAADCYLFQIQAVGNEAGVAAHGTVGKLRTELIEALGVDEDYRMRFEWDAADGWPLLDAVPAPVRRAEALIEHYQTFDNIEELSTPDFGQHISDMIADLLHYAHDTQTMDPFGLLDTGLTHFHAEIRQHEPAPVEDKVPLRLLVATNVGQGQRSYDFCHTLPGEVVYPGACADPQPLHACGCLESLVGVESRRRTTTFTVAEVATSRQELCRAVAKAENLTENEAAVLAEDMLAAAARFPVGAVLGKSARRYRRRITNPDAPASSAASPAPAPVPDGRDEDEPDDDGLRLWTVRISEQREYEFTVEAADEDDARDSGWDRFDDSRCVDSESEITVSLAA